MSVLLVFLDVSFTICFGFSVFELSRAPLLLTPNKTGNLKNQRYHIYRIFAIENNFFNIEEQWSKDYWPSSVGDVDEKHWIAIKDGHVQALNLNIYNLGEIPPSIHFLHELKHLVIINNRLIDVPNSLFPHVIGIITKKYFREGVEANDASVLAILELLTTIYKDESSSLKYN
ncbi:hypothetical protein LCGC14_1239820 [marine sediment metagenome]|uniref:Uncharacterized protein n=1 Tax=marine sediment metagenome TaxID=412755 RepID=A0A0F9NND4_9ZZZZ|nr:hypothetical protein [bacterium]